MTPYLFLLLLNSYHYKVMIWVKKSKQKGAMIIVTSDSLTLLCLAQVWSPMPVQLNFIFCFMKEIMSVVDLQFQLFA